MLSFKEEGTRVVLIGTSKCPLDETNLPELPSVRNNIKQLKELFLDPKIVGLPLSCVEIIEDPPSPSLMLKSLSKAAKSATDTLIVYYSGHGLKSSNANGLFLATLDTTQDECHLDGAEFSRVRQIIFDSPASKKILIFDCCYSGEINSSEMGGGDEAIIASNINIRGTYSIASAPRNSLAFAPPGERFTAFTNELVQVIGEGVKDAKEFLTLDKIYAEVKKRIASNPKLPEPQRKVESDLDEFVFARNIAWSNDPEIRIRKLQEAHQSEIARINAERKAYEERALKEFQDLQVKLSELVVQKERSEEAVLIVPKLQEQIKNLTAEKGRYEDAAKTIADLKLRLGRTVSEKEKIEEAAGKRLDESEAKMRVTLGEAGRRIEAAENQVRTLKEEVKRQELALAEAQKAQTRKSTQDAGGLLIISAFAAPAVLSIITFLVANASHFASRRDMLISAAWFFAFLFLLLVVNSKNIVSSMGSKKGIILIVWYLAPCILWVIVSLNLPIYR